jgi:hypothetical protein
MQAPPPVLCNAKVLEYISIDPSIDYAGSNSMYVDGEVLGRVPALAICQNYKAREVLLFHCDENWNVIGGAEYPSVEAAKARAEKRYPGSGRHWMFVAIPDRFEDWPVKLAPLCSFCGKSHLEIDTMFQGNQAHICNECVGALQRILGETPPKG